MAVALEDRHDVGDALQSDDLLAAQRPPERRFEAEDDSHVPETVPARNPAEDAVRRDLLDAPLQRRGHELPCPIAPRHGPA